jgi:hypothetical protein
LAYLRRPFSHLKKVVRRARESNKRERERKNTLRGNKLSRKLSELVSGKLGVFGDLGL